MAFERGGKRLTDMVYEHNSDDVMTKFSTLSLHQILVPGQDTCIDLYVPVLKENVRPLEANKLNIHSN